MKKGNIGLFPSLNGFGEAIIVAKPIVTGYFLEDIAHERFMKALVERIALEQGIRAENLSHDIRNATGGSGKSLAQFKRFLHEYAKGRESAFDIIVVAIDGNCTGYTQKRSEITAIKEQTGYGGQLVCAVPDPHIERWYLADGIACQKAIRSTAPPDCPAYKCEKGRYKNALGEAIRSAGVITLLGGAEFGPQIVEEMDFYRAGQNDSSLKHFIEELRVAFGPFIEG